LSHGKKSKFETEEIKVSQDKEATRYKVCPPHVKKKKVIFSR